MMKLGLVLLCLLYSLPAMPAAKKVLVHFDWPGAQSAGLELSLFQAKTGSRVDVGSMGKLTFDVSTRIGAKVEEPLTITPGMGQSLYLVVENKTDAPIRFGVAPHGSTPAEATIDINFRCLCYGHTYTVEARSKWYRVIALRVDRQTQIKNLRLKHEVYRR
ncbi:MAG: hypothetical protein ACK5P7_07500 [Bdellovibrio sp.]